MTKMTPRQIMLCKKLLTEKISLEEMASIVDEDCGYKNCNCPKDRNRRPVNLDGLDDSPGAQPLSHQNSFSHDSQLYSSEHESLSSANVSAYETDASEASIAYSHASNFEDSGFGFTDFDQHNMGDGNMDWSFLQPDGAGMWPVMEDEDMGNGVGKGMDTKLLHERLLDEQHHQGGISRGSTVKRYSSSKRDSKATDISRASTVKRLSQKTDISRASTVKRNSSLRKSANLGDVTETLEEKSPEMDLGEGFQYLADDEFAGEIDVDGQSTVNEETDMNVAGYQIPAIMEENSEVGGIDAVKRFSNCTNP